MAKPYVWEPIDGDGGDSNGQSEPSIPEEGVQVPADFIHKIPRRLYGRISRKYKLNDFDKDRPRRLYMAFMDPEVQAHLREGDNEESAEEEEEEAKLLEAAPPALPKKAPSPVPVDKYHLVVANLDGVVLFRITIAGVFLEGDGVCVFACNPSISVETRRDVILILAREDGRAIHGPLRGVGSFTYRDTLFLVLQTLEQSDDDAPSHAGNDQPALQPVESPGHSPQLPDHRGDA